MFEPKHNTSLSAAEYWLIMAGLRLEIKRLNTVAARKRDKFDCLGWAEAVYENRLASALLGRLSFEVGNLPEPTRDERDWKEDRIERLASKVPRSTANSVAHRKALLKRRRAAEERLASLHAISAT